MVGKKMGAELMDDRKIDDRKMGAEAERRKTVNGVWKMGDGKLSPSNRSIRSIQAGREVRPALAVSARDKRTASRLQLAQLLNCSMGLYG